MNKKILTIFLLMVIIFFGMHNIVMAFGIGDIIKEGKDFASSGTGNTYIPEDRIHELSNSILSILIPVGIAAAVIVSGILGIKYIIGSADEKADVKGLMIPFIVGCVIMFGAFTIWKIALVIMESTGL